MATTLYPPPRAQSIGELLDSAFRIFGATLVKCLPYAIAAVILGQLPALYQLSRAGNPLRSASALQFARDPVWWLMVLVAALLNIALTNALILRQYSLITGGKASVSGELLGGARYTLGVVLISVVLMLLVCVSMIPVGILGAVLLYASGLRAGAAAAGVAFAVVGLIAASWVVVRWIVAVPVYLVTERGAMESMSHSWSLTAGSFWRLSAIYAVAIVVLIVLYVVGGAVGAVATALLAGGDVAVVTAALTTVVVLLGAIARPFYSGLMLAVLGDLLVRREGADIAQRIAAATE